MPKDHRNDDKPRLHDASEPMHDDRRPKAHGSGPKERELATELTVAILRVSEFPKNDPIAVADATAEVYRKMLELIGPAGPTANPKPRP